MKQKHNGGFSLIEVLVSIVLLAAVVVPTCSALVLSHRLNAETDKLMKAQLAVSSAVETLMAEGIPSGTDDTPNGEDYGNDGTTDRFPDVLIKVVRVSIEQIQPDGTSMNVLQPYYEVTVRAVDIIEQETNGTKVNVEKELASVTTTIRAK